MSSCSRIVGTSFTFRVGLASTLPSTNRDASSSNVILCLSAISRRALQNCLNVIFRSPFFFTLINIKSTSVGDRKRPTSFVSRLNFANFTLSMVTTPCTCAAFKSLTSFLPLLRIPNIANPSNTDFSWRMTGSSSKKAFSAAAFLLASAAASLIPLFPPIVLLLANAGRADEGEDTELRMVNEFACPGEDPEPRRGGVGLALAGLLFPMYDSTALAVTLKPYFFEAAKASGDREEAIEEEIDGDSVVECSPCLPGLRDTDSSSEREYEEPGMDT
mmetsp:Transcript_47983/g.124603  ORF Transcript_47983/g.124603 Transcript_47983/m.124603 type:complete len:274 (-) Transcript_47983:1169-1990(-)